MLNSNEISNWIYRTCNAYCWIGKAKKLHSLHSKLKLSTVPEHRTYDLLIRPSHVLVQEQNDFILTLILW